MDTDALINYFATHQYAAAVGTILTALVYLAHNATIAAKLQELPRWAIPFLPVFLSVLAMEGEALVSGKPWFPALLAALITAAPAVVSATTPFLSGKRDTEAEGGKR